MLLLFCVASYNGQNSGTDSLKIILKSKLHDSIRITVLSVLAHELRYEKPDTAIGLLQEALKIAEKYKTEANSNSNLKQAFIKKEGDILHSLGVYYEAEGNITPSLNAFKRSLKIRQQQNDKKNIAISLNSIANIMADQGQIKEALDYYHTSLKIREEIKDKGGVAKCLLNIANIYSDQKQLKEALDYYSRGLTLCEEIGNKPLMALFFNNMALVYSDEGKTEEALKYYQRRIKIAEELENEALKVSPFINMADIYIRNGDLSKALEYSEQALKISESTENKEGYSNSLYSISYIQKEQGKIESALKNALIFMQLSKELGYPEKIGEGAALLRDIYERQGNFKKAYEMSTLYLNMHDSINNEEIRRASYKSQLKYTYDKKALADSIKRAGEKKITSAQLAEKTAKLKQEKTQRLALYGGLILVLIFAGFIYNRLKNSQRQKRIIEEQKILVDESQRKIISSINYAKKIQYSILPSDEEISGLFPHHFVLFKPKDIVSGDFYWFHHENDLSFFAVIDCTGHGVPGAFMTMIAHSILIEVVVEKKITTPDKILSSLHHLVFKSLQQQKGDEYSQDGMDISFAVIDHKKKLLHFSAARNNAYLMDNDKIQILKATQKSIGGLSLLGEVEPDRDFKLETLKLKKDTLLVFSTDGIFDQLNEQDEKFGSARFKEMLLSLNANNAKENLQTLEATFNTWRGGSLQLDDVLVAGVKL